MTFTGAAPLGTIAGFTSRNDGKRFALDLPRTAGSTATINLLHFTVGGVASSPCDNLDNLPTTGSTPEETAHNRLALLTLRQQCGQDYSPADVAAILSDYYFAQDGARDALAAAGAF